MKTETLILIGLALYFFSKKSGTPLNCPGSPGCPGYVAPIPNASPCQPGYGLWTNYDPVQDTFTTSCGPLS